MPWGSEQMFARCNRRKRGIANEFRSNGPVFKGVAGDVPNDATAASSCSAKLNPLAVAIEEPSRQSRHDAKAGGARSRRPRAREYQWRAVLCFVVTTLGQQCNYAVAKDTFGLMSAVRDDITGLSGKYKGVETDPSDFLSHLFGVETFGCDMFIAEGWCEWNDGVLAGMCPGRCLKSTECQDDPAVCLGATFSCDKVWSALSCPRICKRAQCVEAMEAKCVDTEAAVEAVFSAVNHLHCAPPPAPTTPAPPAPGPAICTDQLCGKNEFTHDVNGNACYCNADCLLVVPSDCCSDYQSVCTDLTTTEPFVPTTAAPLCAGSCEARDRELVGFAGNCACDLDCIQNRDCCTDYTAECLEGFAQDIFRCPTAAATQASCDAIISLYGCESVIVQELCPASCDLTRCTTITSTITSATTTSVTSVTTVTDTTTTVTTPTATSITLTATTTTATATSTTATITTLTTATATTATLTTVTSTTTTETQTSTTSTETSTSATATSTTATESSTTATGTSITATKTLTSATATSATVTKSSTTNTGTAITVTTTATGTSATVTGTLTSTTATVTRTTVTESSTTNTGTSITVTTTSATATESSTTASATITTKTSTATVTRLCPPDDAPFCTPSATSLCFHHDTNISSVMQKDCPVLCFGCGMSVKAVLVVDLLQLAGDTLSLADAASAVLAADIETGVLDATDLTEAQVERVTIALKDPTVPNWIRATVVLTDAADDIATSAAVTVLSNKLLLGLTFPSSQGDLMVVLVDTDTIVEPASTTTTAVTITTPTSSTTTTEDVATTQLVSEDPTARGSGDYYDDTTDNYADETTVEAPPLCNQQATLFVIISTASSVDDPDSPSVGSQGHFEALKCYAKRTILGLADEINAGYISVGIISFDTDAVVVKTPSDIVSATNIIAVIDAMDHKGSRANLGVLDYPTGANVAAAFAKLHELIDAGDPRYGVYSLVLSDGTYWYADAPTDDDTAFTLEDQLAPFSNSNSLRFSVAVGSAAVTDPLSETSKFILAEVESLASSPKYVLGNANGACNLPGSVGMSTSLLLKQARVSSYAPIGCYKPTTTTSLTTTESATNTSTTATFTVTSATATFTVTSATVTATTSSVTTTSKTGTVTSVTTSKTETTATTGTTVTTTTLPPPQECLLHRFKGPLMGARSRNIYRLEKIEGPSTVLECAEECLARRKCNAFSQRLDKPKCDLFTKGGPNPEITPHRGTKYVHYYKRPSCFTTTVTASTVTSATGTDTTTTATATSVTATTYTMTTATATTVTATTTTVTTLKPLECWFDAYRGPLIGAQGLEKFLVKSVEKPVRSAAECALLCTFTRYCKAFSHAASQCELYKKGSPENSRSGTAFNFYFKRKECKPTTAPTTAVTKTSSTGTTVTVPTTTSTATTKTTTTITATTATETTGPQCVDGQYKAVADDSYLVFAHKVGFPYLAVLSPEVCAKLCTAISQCNAFSFSPAEQTCALSGSSSENAVLKKVGYTHYVMDAVACTGTGKTSPSFSAEAPKCENGFVNGDDNGGSCECSSDCSECTLGLGAAEASLCTVCKNRKYLFNGECVGAGDCIQEGMIPIAPHSRQGFYCVTWP